MANFFYKHFLLILCILAGYQLFGNNLTITNSSLQVNPNAGWVYVQFDISWENSWRTSTGAANWDAAWVFIKYRVGSGDWQHAKLSPDANDHIAPSGSTLFPTADSMGVFIYRDADGTGNVNFTTAKLAWKYAVDGVAGGASIDFKVLGIEMVYVPQGSFWLGDGVSAYTFRQTGSNTPVKITTIANTIKQEGSFSGAGDAILESGVTVDGDNGICTTGTGTIDNPNYPTGYKAFYCMKYEMSQGQYATFLNLLTSSQSSIRFPNQNGNYRHTISGTYPNFFASAPDRACNYLSWNDGAAYSDWSGLRPMTELEFEKACRGTANSVPGEYAWGSTSITSSCYTISNDGLPDESVNAATNIGNATYYYTNISCGTQGPLRCGIFAASSANKTRQETGATYYGIMEMSGNVWERIVTIGNSTGRSFTGLHGNGRLASEGDADVSTWPVANSVGSGLRGGNLGDYGYGVAVSLRYDAAYVSVDPRFWGFRCARVASPDLLPDILTSPVTEIASNGATCGGIINSEGSEAVTARGICWSTSINPTIANSKTSDGTGIGSFVSLLTGLNGDSIYYVRAYATNNVGTTYGNEISFATTFADYDGNVYNIVTIGTQTWMKENLKVIHYNNGDPISDGSGIGDYSGQSTPKYYFNYGDNIANVATYGRLYTYYAAMDIRGICPTGWHIPSHAEWTTLSDFNGGEAVAGGILKETGTTHWTSPNTGATNVGGFTGLPNGYRNSYEGFHDINNYNYYLSSTEFNAINEYVRSLRYNNVNLVSGYIDKKHGCAIRFIKNNIPTVTTTAISNISQTTSTSGGNVTYNGGTTVTARGVCWSTSTTPTIENNKTIDGTDTGSFVSSLTGLTGGTIYYMRAYATNNEGTSYGNEISFSTSISDIQGNVYKTIQIGTQIWMAENLKATKFNDNTVIPLVTDGAAWAALSTPGYCWYNNDSATYNSTFGVIYNWYTVNAGNLCPTGWHIPSDPEWKTLEMYLGMTLEEANSTDWRGTDQGTQLKNTSGWDSGGNGTNTNGFSALPGGYRGSSSSFGDIGSFGYWWGSTEYDSFSAWYRVLYSYSSDVARYHHYKQDGFSVRCLGDN